MLLRVVTGEGGTSKVYVELADGEQIPFDPQKATSVYAAQFAEIGQQLDAWLQALDASLVPEPLPSIQVHPEH